MKKKSTNKLSMLPEYILEAGNKKAVGKAACVKYKSSGSYYIRSSRSKTQKWAIVLSNLEEAHSPWNASSTVSQLTHAKSILLIAPQDALKAQERLLWYR